MPKGRKLSDEIPQIKNYKLTIEYDGTDFNGWQVQESGKRTVQGEIEKALEKILKKKTHLSGSGRTDSGTHAAGQVANFKGVCRLDPLQLEKAINGNTPDDVSILKVEEVSLDFHAQYSAKRKTYRYTILNRQSPTALNWRFAYHFPYRLNLSAMKREVKSLVGKKDFRSFMASGSTPKRKDKNTVRTIHSLKIVKKGDYIHIDIEANGFLYKMVRNIVGTLLDVGTRRLPSGALAKILLAKDRKLASATAPAYGLCLMAVEYKEGGGPTKKKLTSS
ncbi:MAG: tRNA pseudouridine(38-40) synthase TruA [Candidatus Omnitrophica bacterium]|nr:tRNA pseudouridine(38-40) synthase TruA [Candidatus Omnitrophota bacterium]